MGILILLTLMNGDVATVNNDELFHIQYTICMIPPINYRRIIHIVKVGKICPGLDVKHPYNLCLE